MKRIIYFIFISLISFSPLMSEKIIAQKEEGLIDYEKEISELGKSIEMLRRWQSQYLKKQKSFEAHNRRVLFRGNSTQDGKKMQILADEAKKNALELQEQIDTLMARRDGLMTSTK